MTKFIVLAILSFMLLSTGCKSDIKQESLLEIDHILIWVKDPIKMKAKIEDLGFKGIPDSLSAVHKGQGTAGRYFNFLNGYLELIYINDHDEFQNNVKANDSLDFQERNNHLENGFSPFGIALQMKEYAPNTIPFKTIKYHQNWMGEGKNIYSAANSKVNKAEPSLFVVFPEIASDKFESEKDLIKIPEEYAIYRDFFKHENGAKKITKLVYTLTETSKKTKTIEELKKIGIVDFKVGEKYFLEIYFDHNQQGKKFDLRPDLPIKIYL